MYIFIPLIFYPQNVYMTAESRAHLSKKSSVVKLWSGPETEEEEVRASNDSIRHYKQCCALASFNTIQTGIKGFHFSYLLYGTVHRSHWALAHLN